MAEGKHVSYIRVSTTRQGKSGLGLEAQRRAVRDHLGNNGWELIAEFVEVESGKKNNRPELEKALAACKRERATLVIARLDRLARNVHFVAGLLESGVAFTCCDMPEADRAFLQMAAVFAEWEGRKISERTKAALKVAKERGTLLGYANPSRKDGERARSSSAALRTAKADQFASNVAPIIKEIEASGVSSLWGIAKALTARGVATARNGDWHPATVRNVLARAAE